MTNDSLIDPSAISAGAHNGNGSLDYYYYIDIYEYIYYEPMCFNSINIFYDFTVLIYIFGILGNGMVIWVLGFRIKRNHLTTFILNLTVADFGVLMAAVMHRIKSCSYPDSFENKILLSFFSYMFLFIFSTSQMLLTVISMDRCVSVFFPLWHGCHQPKLLSTVVCTLMWLIPFLTASSDFIFYLNNDLHASKVVIYLFIANGFLCLLLMTVSSLMLFIKTCCKSKQQRRQKLITTILVTVSFFLFCFFPFSALIMNTYFFGKGKLFFYLAMSCACLNSSVKPLIYYLVGKPRKGGSNKSMKFILQKLFKEEEI